MKFKFEASISYCRMLLPLVLMLLGSLSVLGVLLPTPVTADLVASYQFEEGSDGSTATGSNSILDSSGNGLHGTPFGGPIYRNVNGSIALEFDGVDGRVFIPDDPLFEITQSLTLKAVIRLAGMAPTPQRIIFRGDK